MTRTIPIRLSTRTVQITPHWAGKNLAIHRPVSVNPGDNQIYFDLAGSSWCITHIGSGMAAGRLEGSLKRAKAFAREWDEAFSLVTNSKLPSLLRRSYMAGLAIANNGSSRADIIEAEG